MATYILTDTGNVDANGTTLQAFLDKAMYGDTITVPHGVTCRGSFHLPVPGGDSTKGYITIQTDRVSALPATRPDYPAIGQVTPADAVNMPKLVCPAATNAVVFWTSPGACYWKFWGVEIAPNDDTKPMDFLIRLDSAPQGTGDSKIATDADQPHHIWFEQCYVHMLPTEWSQVKHGIIAHCKFFKFNHSFMDEIKATYAESHGVINWNSTGPTEIVGSTIYATGENFFFGGVGPSWRIVPGQTLDPATGLGINIHCSVFSKRLKWNPLHPSYTPRTDGQVYVCKNLGEIKSGVNWLIDSCFFQYSWMPTLNGGSRGQDGGGFLINMTNYSGSGIEQCKSGAFTNNWTDSVNCAFNVAYPGPTTGDELIQGVLFDNNLYTNLGWPLGNPVVGGSAYTGRVKGGMYIEESDKVSVTRNTLRLAPSAYSQTYFIMTQGGQASPSRGVACTNFILSGNIGFTGAYPFDLQPQLINSKAGADQTWPGAVCTGNVLWDSDGSDHGLSRGFFTGSFAGNTEVAHESDIGFVGTDQSVLTNNALALTSPYYNKAGCDVTKLSLVPGVTVPPPPTPSPSVLTITIPASVTQVILNIPR